MEIVWKIDGKELIAVGESGDVIAKVGDIPMVKVNKEAVGLELPSGYGCTLCDKNVWISGPKFSDRKRKCPKAKAWCEAMLSLLSVDVATVG